MSHCAGTVQMRQELESGIRKWEEMWFKMMAEDRKREGAAVMCNGRLYHRRVAVTGKALLLTVDRRVCRTSGDIDEAERIVIIWLECLLVDVVRHIGMLAPDRVDICTVYAKWVSWQHLHRQHLDVVNHCLTLSVTRIDDTDANDYVVVQGWSGDGDGETSSVDFMSLPPHIRLALFFLFLMSWLLTSLEVFLCTHKTH